MIYKYNECKLLKSIHIPASVSNIKYQSPNKDLNITVDPNNKFYYVDENILHARDNQREKILREKPERKNQKKQQPPAYLLNGPVVKRYKIVNGKKVLISIKPYKENSEKKKK